MEQLYERDGRSINYCNCLFMRKHTVGRASPAALGLGVAARGRPCAGGGRWFTVYRLVGGRAEGVAWAGAPRFHEVPMCCALPAASGML